MTRTIRISTAAAAATLATVVLAPPVTAQDDAIRLQVPPNRARLERGLDADQFRRALTRPVIPRRATGAGAPRGPAADDNRFIRERLGLEAGPAANEAMANAARAGGTAVTVLEFAVRPSAAQRRDLATRGITIEGFVGGTTYIASVDAAAAGDPIADASAVVSPQQKLRSTIALPRPQLQPPAPSRGATRASNTETFLVRASRVAGADVIAAALRDGGAASVDEVVAGTFAVRAAPDRLLSMAGVAAVLSIGPGPPPFIPLRNAVRRIADAEPAQNFSAANGTPDFARYSGLGVRVAVFDTAIEERHQDFCDILGDPTLDRFFHRGSSDPVCASEVSGDLRGEEHGTAVASVAVGSGLKTEAANPELLFLRLPALPPFGLRGIAPRAMLGEFEAGADGAKTLDLYKLTVIEQDVDVSNHSYVETLDVYDDVAHVLDEIIAGQAQATRADGTLVDIPARPQVWAAGNNALEPADGERTGYFSVFTQAKNTISVGSVDTDTRRISAFSSLGPTFDGRIKPDLVAPGCHDSSVTGTKGGVLTARYTTQGYMRACGTSLAAPVVTGIIALMTEAVRSVDPDRRLRPSSYKAALVASAQDLELAPGSSDTDPNPDTGEPIAYDRGPDFATGFGLVDAASAVALAEGDGLIVEGTVNDETTAVALCFDVSPGTARLRIALAWDDPPPLREDDRIGLLTNDLDLRLLDPAGEPHLPWTLVPPPLEGDLVTVTGPAPNPIAASDIHPAERGEDRLNTVELAEVDLPDAGIWRAEVSTHILGLGPQPFSIAGHNRMGECEED